MAEDRTGMKFGKLTVVRKSDQKYKHGGALWECLCECGNTKLARYCDLNAGNVSSCGCAIKRGKDDFIALAKKTHGDRYSYDKVDYQHSQTKVIITCRTHGDFNTTPNVHIAGSVCPKCAKEEFKSSRVTLEDFINKARKAFGDKYNYSLITADSYKGITKSVDIICPEHGVFRQNADSHTRGKVGCKGCIGKVHDIHSFLKACKRVHGDTYDYSKVKFIKTKEKVEIVCKQHGAFYQTPHNHIAGKHGCPTCGKSGFDMKLPSSLYVMELDDIIKVGVTNRTADQRATNLRHNSKMPFKVLKEYSNLDGKLCWDVETILLKELSAKYKRVQEKFDGSSECFYDVDKAWLLNTIEENIERYSK